MPMPSSAEPRRDLGVRGGASPAASVVVATSSDPSAEPEDPAASRAIAWMVGEGPVATLPPRASSPTNPLAHGARTGGAADGLRRRRGHRRARIRRSEEHTSELQSLMRISYAVFCLKKKNQN